MTDDERAFLAAIQAEPECDTHRLVYADWLQEQGREDRAQLIRFQIAKQTLPVMSAPWAVTTRQAKKEKSQLTERRRSQKTEGELIGAVIAPYMGPGLSVAHFEFERGLITRVNATAPIWCHIADALLAREWAPSVCLTDANIPSLPGRTRESRVFQLAGELVSVALPAKHANWPSCDLVSLDMDMNETTEERLVAKMLVLIAFTKRWPEVLFELRTHEYALTWMGKPSLTRN